MVNKELKNIISDLSMSKSIPIFNKKINSIKVISNSLFLELEKMEQRNTDTYYYLKKSESELSDFCNMIVSIETLLDITLKDITNLNEEIKKIEAPF